MIMVNPKLNVTAAQNSMAPAINYANSPASESTLLAQVFTSGSWWQAYQTFILPNEEKVGIGLSLASRLIPSSLLSSAAGQTQFVSALSNISELVIDPNQGTGITEGNSAPLELLAVTPYSYQAPPGTSNTDSSVTPAWRSSTLHVIAGQAIPNGANVSMIQKAFSISHQAGNILRALAPNSGAYQNEADVFEPDPIDSFWGRPNYNKLKTIKASIDPKNILTCWGCIGWNPSDPRYGCYPQVNGCSVQAY